MKKFIVLALIAVLSGCTVGEFTPERHAAYEQGHPDCNKTPERCINGVPW